MFRYTSSMITTADQGTTSTITMPNGPYETREEAEIARKEMIAMLMEDGYSIDIEEDHIAAWKQNHNVEHVLHEVVFDV